MGKLGKSGTQRLKAFHIIFFVMWMGGVMALVTVQLLGHPSSPEMYLMAARDQLVIDMVLIIPGGVGIIATAALYPLLTRMGSPKKLWIRWKWILTVVLLAIGAGFMGVSVKSNTAYVERAIAEGTFNSAVYWDAVIPVAVAGIIQLVLFLVVLHLSITKPLGKRSRQNG